MRILTSISIILLFTCSWSITGCVSIFTKHKEIKLLQYYHIDKKELHSELSKIVNEIGGTRVKGDIVRAYDQALSFTSSFQPGSRQRTAPNSFTIVKFKGLEYIRSISAYSPARGRIMKCNNKSIITRGMTLAPLGGGKYTATIFATSQKTDHVEYDLRKLKNICFQASRESMTSGGIESNLIKLQ